MNQRNDLNKARLMATEAMYLLASATHAAALALTAAERAFAEAGCTDIELDDAVRFGREAIATTARIDDALTIARDCCEALGAEPIDG